MESTTLFYIFLTLLLQMYLISYSKDNMATNRGCRTHEKIVAGGGIHFIENKLTQWKPFLQWIKIKYSHSLKNIFCSSVSGLKILSFKKVGLPFGFMWQFLVMPNII